jgi:hypothetical protein
MHLSGNVNSNSLPLRHFVVNVYIVVSLILLPLLRYQLPLNAAVLDVWFLIALPALAFVMIATPRPRATLFFIGPMWFILIGSIIAIFLAYDTVVGIVTIVKDIYLYLWFVVLTICLRIMDDIEFRRFLTVWLIVGLIHGVFTIVQYFVPAVLVYTTAFIGQYGAEGAVRPMGLFRDPNMAGAFQQGIFIPLLLVRPQSNLLRLVLGLVIAMSILATGSLTMILTLVAGAGVLILLSVLTGKGSQMISRAATVFLSIGLLAGILFLIYSLVMSDIFLIDRLNYLERISFARTQSSLGDRESIWNEGIRILQSRWGVWGLGPGNLNVRVGGMAKELHNDWLSFLIERGILGFIGLLLFGFSAMFRAIQELRKRWQDSDSAWPLVVLISAGCAIFLQSFAVEIFHFRFHWLVLAVLMVYVDAMKSPPVDQPSLRTGVTHQTA